MRNLKDKKIILYKKETIKDSAGFSTTVYKAIHAGKLWAYVRQLSAGSITLHRHYSKRKKCFLP